MMFIYAVGIFLVSLLVTTNDACFPRPPPVRPSVRWATCSLVGSISGNLTLKDCGNALNVTGQLRGVPPGLHAIHVHEKGEFGDNCTAAGGHYNPQNRTHGAPNVAERHVGDWGNFNATSDPYQLNITDSVAKLSGNYSILNRAIVIHAGVDDLGLGGNDGSRLNGNAGARLACCKILLAP